MKKLNTFVTVLSLVSVFTSTMAQPALKKASNDSLVLAQAYMNLSLTTSYFDSLDTKRISKILPFEADELNAIVAERFIDENSTLYHFTHSLLHFNTAKFKYRTHEKIERAVLVQWKETLDAGMDHFNLAKIHEYKFVEGSGNSFYNLIKFDYSAIRQLESGLKALKDTFTGFFNDDIYPDFKAVYQKSMRTGQYDFESLKASANLYNFPLRLSILENEPTLERYRDSGRLTSFVSTEYRLERKLELLAEYLQLKYMTTEQYTVPSGRFDTQVLYASYRSFVNGLKYEKDAFIQKELTPQVQEQLYEALQKKFPPKEDYGMIEYAADLAQMQSEVQERTPYFFPNPAPQSSAYMSVTNFKPQSTRLSQVDAFLKTHLTANGYGNQLRYWYDLDGFALGTQLEKFNKNGDPVAIERRFIEALGGDGQFSYYEIFKSIFFELVSEFRMFVFVVASQNVSFTDEMLSASRTDELLRNSYKKLPDDLRNKILAQKNLSILVYHFHQNDIGQVPMLDLTEQWTVVDHLQHAGLLPIIEE